jgi:hypothetical protein
MSSNFTKRTNAALLAAKLQLNGKKERLMTLNKVNQTHINQITAEMNRRKTLRGVREGGKRRTRRHRSKSRRTRRHQ